MPRKPRHTRTFTVKITHDGPHPESFDDLFAQYLTTPDCPFLEDYGPHAWGGYEGPFVTKVKVTVGS